MTGRATWPRVIALSLAGAGLAFAALLACVVAFDHGYLKPEAERRLSAALGRRVAIDGDMHLTIRRTIQVTVEGLRIVSADWTEKPDLVHIGSLSATLSTASLVRGQVEILDLAVDDTLICLEKHPDGRVNWRFDAPAPGAGPETGSADAPQLVVRNATLRNARAVLKSPDLDQKLQVTVDSLTQTIDEAGIMTTILAGDVNGTPLTADARVEDLANLVAGRQVAARIGGALGEIRLDADVAIDDLGAPERPRLRLSVAGPDFAYLAAILKLPATPAGALEATATLEPDGERMTFHADAEIGRFTMAAEGSVDDLAAPRAIDAKLEARGESAAAVAAVLGIPHVPSVPFTLAADVATRGADMRIDSLRLTLADHALDGAGSLHPGNPLGVDAQVELRGPDAAALGALFGIAGVPARPYSVSGRVVTRPGGGARFEGVHADFGRDVLSGSGEVRFAPPSITAVAHAVGPDARAVAAAFGTPNVPSAPYDLRTRLEYRDGRLRFAGLALRLGDMRLTGEGDLRFDPLALDARLDAGGSSTAAVGTWFGHAALVPADAWTLAGRAAYTDGRLRFEDLVATVGADRLMGSGEIVLGEPVGVAARLEAEGPSAAAVAKRFGVERLPAKPYAVAVHVATGADGLAFEDGHVQVGRNSIAGRGRYRAGAVPYAELELMAGDLDIGDYIGDYIGDFSGNEAAVAPATPGTPPPDGRMIPDVELPLEALAAVDTRVDLRVARLTAATRELRDVTLVGSTKDGRLSVERLELTGQDGGRFEAALRVEPRAGGLDVAAEIAGHGLDLGLPAATEAERAALPRYDVAAAAAAHGSTLRELAASADGYLSMKSGPGRLRSSGMRFLTNDFLSQLLATVNPFLHQDPYSEVQCAVLFLHVDDGLLQADPGLVVRTARLDVVAQGQVNLASETLAADISTVPRKGLGVSLSNVIYPYIQVRGTLAGPELAIDKEATLVEGGAAIATGGLSILAKGLFGRLRSGENPCDAAAEHAGPAFEALARQYGGVLSAGQ